jgi:purine nucleosidase
MRKHKIVLDTDIGTDVDDAMALALLLGREDVEILGITTVYGDTDLRSKIAARYARLIGAEIPIYPGSSETLSGRAIWVSGLEGSLLQDLDEERVESRSGVDFLCEAVANNPGEIDVVAIGPLTNIAKAIELDQTFARNVKHLWVMGGEFETEFAEHNFRCDDRATKIVMDSGISMTITGVEITKQLRIMRSDLEIIATAGSMGSLLFAEIDQWLTYRKEDFDVPHDPIAIMPMLEPELFTFSKVGVVDIEISDSDLTGKSRFSEQGSGHIRIVQGFKKVEVQSEILASILRAG